MLPSEKKKEEGKGRKRRDGCLFPDKKEHVQEQEDDRPDDDKARQGSAGRCNSKWARVRVWGNFGT